MPVDKLRQFLDAEGVKYVLIIHSRAYTAQEIAESAHVSGKDLAKTVIVKIDGTMAMAVVPAPEKAPLARIREVVGARKVELATEDEFRSLFPDCELGAMPPFGNLYGLDVYVAESLSTGREIAFNAGSFVELVRLAYEDFERLVRPKVIAAL